MSRVPRGWRTHLDELQAFLTVALQCAAVPVVHSILDASRMQSARELFQAYLNDLQTAEVFVPAVPEDRPWYASFAGCGPEERLALSLLVARFVSRMERYDLTTDLAHLTVPIGVFTKFPRVLLGQLLARDLAPDGPAWAELLDAAEALQRLFPGGEDLVVVLDALYRTFSSGKLPAALRAELASTAARWLSRAELLERLLPKLPIGERCSVDGRFLVVRGDLGEYRIHLNSAGVLMQPGDRYLCIVPDRSIMGTLPRKLYLPFEGDEGLSIILSKAFLLAADSKITDPTIVRQISAHD